ncbi:hypothetical protein SL1157_0465 [Ruegeria lacuscaerulensis ITI-1157]|nr:hypothetical protein SL1157_0465 [Ruegeria lacuscaerulensis ITI-1157]SHK11544.1 hypothetical protein SAMN05444404_3310 [Ruegeria lacuscaerulensis ITI-1157]
MQKLLEKHVRAQRDEFALEGAAEILPAWGKASSRIQI